MKAIITVGVSASGKSTFAKEWVKEGYAKKSYTDKDGEFEVYRNIRAEINRDTIRQGLVEADGKEWSWSAWNWKREGEVTEIVTARINAAIDAKKDIIVSDTNLSAKYRNAMVKMLESHGYKVEFKEFPVTWEEAVKRDNARANGVGITVLATQWKQWLEYTGRKTYVPNKDKPKCILVDIDGTAAAMFGRKAYDWHLVGNDKPDEAVRLIVNSLPLDVKIIFMSGRDSVCRDVTQEWLNKHNFRNDGLFMRPENDMRKDTVIKEELFWAEIAPNYNVLFCIDDRPVVVRMYHDLGVKVFAVGNQHIEF
jgi:predicted kinase